MSDDEQRRWRQRERQRVNDDENDDRFDENDTNDDDGRRDHIDYMLENGRLQATCAALEAALAKTSMKLREVDTKATMRIRALESELRRKTTATTRPRSMMMMMSPSSPSSSSSLALAGRSPSPTILEASSELQDDYDDPYNDDGGGVRWMDDRSDIVEDGNRSKSISPDDDNDVHDEYDDDGLMRCWEESTPPSSPNDGEGRRITRTRRTSRHHRTGMVRRRLLTSTAIAIGIATAAIALLAIGITLGVRDMRNSEEALELASEVESEVRDQDHFAGGHVVGIDVPSPSSPPPTLRPTVQIDAPEPMWYSTTHRHYQEILKSTGGGGSMSNGNNNNLTNSDDANFRHVVAEAFCSHVAGMRLCDYASYCPDGRGSAPYGGGPPIADNSTNHGRKRIAQWAPFLLPDDDSVLGGDGAGEDGGGSRATLFGDDVPHWVQVGGVPSDMGGNDENHYASCWTYADWNDEMGGGNGGNIEGVWEGHHRLWMLCCPL